MTDGRQQQAIAASQQAVWPENSVSIANPRTSSLVMEIRKLEEGSVTRQVGEWRLKPGESIEIKLTPRQGIISRMVRA